jgi:S1-C subfamily serine protease
MMLQSSLLILACLAATSSALRSIFHRYHRNLDAHTCHSSRNYPVNPLFGSARCGLSILYGEKGQLSTFIRHRPSASGSRDTRLCLAKSSKDVLTFDDRGRKFIEETLKDLLEKLEHEAMNEGMLDQRSSSSSSSVFQRDGKENQPGESSSLYEDETLNGVIRVYCTHSEPNFNIPWQRKKQESSTSSGFVIAQPHKTSDGSQQKPYIITNAHSVEYGSIIQVKKRQSEKKYLAKVLAGIII